MQVDEIDPGGFPVYVVLPAGVSPDDRLGAGPLCRLRRLSPPRGGRSWVYCPFVPAGFALACCSRLLKASRPPDCSAFHAAS